MAKKDKVYLKQCQNICQMLQVPCTNNLPGELERATKKLSGRNLTLYELEFAYYDINKTAQIVAASLVTFLLDHVLHEYNEDSMILMIIMLIILFTCISLRVFFNQIIPKPFCYLKPATHLKTTRITILLA